MLTIRQIIILIGERRMTSNIRKLCEIKKPQKTYFKKKQRRTINQFVKYMKSNVNVHLMKKRKF